MSVMSRAIARLYIRWEELRGRSLIAMVYGRVGCNIAQLLRHLATSIVDAEV
jgi:hypothetical protein